MPVTNQTDWKNKDFGQTLKEAFDTDLQRLRTETLVSDGTDALIINHDGSLNERIYDSNGALITLGQKTSAQSLPVVIASDQSINATIAPGTLVDTIETGTPDYTFGENPAVASNVSTTLVTYTAGGPTRIKRIEVSGTNIGTYTVVLNSSTVNLRRTYYGNLDLVFDFIKGLPINSGDVVTVNILQTQPSSCEANAFLYALKDY